MTAEPSDANPGFVPCPHCNTLDRGRSTPDTDDAKFFERRPRSGVVRWRHAGIVSNMHLLLPLLASLLFVSGLIFMKRAGAAGVGTATTLFVSNQCTAICFSTLWMFGGDGQPWFMLWQPAIIAFLYILGLLLTFLAINCGDVSIATPLFGVKVLLVAILLTIVGDTPLPTSVWYAAALASFGIAMIQWTGRSNPRRVVTTILLALSASASYATFDVLVQRWAPAWGVGRFLPISFWFVGIFSLTFIPWVQWRLLRKPEIAGNLWPGSVLLALQAICIVFTLSVFGDAARVNVVYALRGLWGVTLAWWVAKRWGGNEQTLSRSILFTRLGGAILLTLAVVLVITAR